MTTTPATTAELPRRDLAHATGAEVRAAVRAGRWRRATHGLARGFVQANLAIVPQGVADEFRQFCNSNPKACPLIGMSAAGDPEMHAVAPGSDLRTDLPGYRIYRDGRLRAEVGESHWSLARRSRRVSSGLQQFNGRGTARGGYSPAAFGNRRRATVGLCLLNRVSARRRFHGPIVASMRPIPEERVADATSISARYPAAHGGPVHVGEPGAIGISDLSAVDWGRYNPLRSGEVPVFWACGVTPQAVAMACRIPEMITHAAGHIFVTDLKLADLAIAT